MPIFGFLLIFILSPVLNEKKSSDLFLGQSHYLGLHRTVHHVFEKVAPSLSSSNGETLTQSSNSASTILALTSNSCSVAFEQNNYERDSFEFLSDSESGAVPFSRIKYYEAVDRLKHDKISESELNQKIFTSVEWFVAYIEIIHQSTARESQNFSEFNTHQIKKISQLAHKFLRLEKPTERDLKKFVVDIFRFLPKTAFSRHKWFSLKQLDRALSVSPDTYVETYLRKLVLEERISVLLDKYLERSSSTLLPKVTAQVKREKLSARYGKIVKVVFGIFSNLPFLTGNFAIPVFLPKTKFFEPNMDSDFALRLVEAHGFEEGVKRYCISSRCEIHDKLKQNLLRNTYNNLAMSLLAVLSVNQLQERIDSKMQQSAAVESAIVLIESLNKISEKLEQPEAQNNNILDEFKTTQGPIEEMSPETRKEFERINKILQESLEKANP